MEIDYDDYILTPSGQLLGKITVSQEGKFLGQFLEIEDALQFIKEKMEKEKFYPNIVWVSDHGNAWPIDLEGNEIEFEEEDCL